jgi:pimeloyl-ACP methyl ester carboxylesterase
MRKLLCGLTGVLFGLAAHAAVAGQLPDTDYELLIEDIALRPGVMVDVHVRVYVDETRPCRGQTLLAVHGFVHTSAAWGPLAEALFAGEAGAAGVVCRVAAVDLPGRGGSSLPTGILYGDLLLADYVTALAGTLDGLEAAGVHPETIVGHSQGGLLVQMLQQRLLDGGASLLLRYGIHRALLLASAPPAGIAWDFVDSGTAGALLGQLIVFDPVLGLVAVVPDALFPSLFFTDTNGHLAAGAPTPAEVAAEGLNAPEPLLVALNLVGAPPLAREEIDPGIFALRNGTWLSMVSYQEDVLIRPAENAVLYQHLTGQEPGRDFVEVTGPETVHDLQLSAPRLILDALGEGIRF